jgi:non-ribosomal peptide synthetase component F
MRLLAWSQSHSLLRRTTVFSQCFPIARGVPNLGLSYWPNSRSDLVSRKAPGIRCLSLSSVSGDCTSPLDDRTLPEYFEQSLLSSFADRPALICRAETRNRFGGPVQQHDAQHLRWTFAEFNNHVEALARGLSRVGIGKGDRVAVIMGNTRFIHCLFVWDRPIDRGFYSAYAALQWACARIGAILVTINPAYRAHELVR